MAKFKTEQEKIEYIRSLKSKISDTEIRKKIGEIWGLKKTARNEKFKKIFAGTTINLCEAYKNEEARLDLIKKAACFKVNGDKAVAEVKNVEDIRTVEDLIAYAKINLNEWQVTKQSANVWDGKWQVKAEFSRRKDEKNLEKLLEKFIEKAQNHAPKSFNINNLVHPGDSFYILSVVDPHFGKLAHGEATGYGDYDLPIAKEYYRSTVNDLINSAPVNKIGKIGIVIGSDAIHCENQRSETSSGTKIEGDTRWHKVFDDTCALMVETIELLASHYPVEVIVMPGNHSRLSEYAMGAYIKAFFKNHPNVKVDNRPLSKKYLSHGKTLIGICHGDGVKKLQDHGAILFRDNLDTISYHKHFYVLTGHKHGFESAMDERGCRIFVSAAICPPDGWHVEHSFTGKVQNAEAYLFSPVNGLEQIIFTKPVNVK